MRLLLHIIPELESFPKSKDRNYQFDAHFDNREPENGLATSGTGFWQIAQEEDSLITYWNSEK
jgi:hypothetical protein